MQGTINKLMPTGGYGFIRPDDGSDDVFFHISRLADGVQFDTLTIGLDVEFDVQFDRRTNKMMAGSIRPALPASIVLHRRLQELVEARHRRNSLQPIQVLRLRMIKIVEEALEAATCIALPARMSPAIDAITDAARDAYRNREWIGQPWVFGSPSDDSIDHLKKELADAFITVVLAARTVVEITGEEWDIEQAALSKATSDLARPPVEYREDKAS